MQAATPGGQLGHLQQLLLRTRLEAAKGEHAALKAALHGEVDAQRESENAERLRAKLQQLALNEAALNQRLVYGLPPGWAGDSRGTSSDSTAAASSGFSWGPWLTGTEVAYSAQPNEPKTATDATAAPLLHVTHTTRPVRLRRSSLPFAIGGLRAAFYAEDELGGRFVLKRALQESSRWRKRVAELHADAEAAALSAAAAVAFNAGSRGKAEVSYLAASVVVLDDSDAGNKLVFLKEPWLASSATSKWVKWSRNDGHLFAEGETCELIQAFMHFSLHWLSKQLRCPAMVLDVQGIQTGKRFTLTDPALCTADQRYGKSDLGCDAIADFLAAHTCGAVCKKCGCTSTGR